MHISIMEGAKQIKNSNFIDALTTVQKQGRVLRIDYCGLRLNK